MTEEIINPQSTILNCKFQILPSGVFEILAINAGIAQDHRLPAYSNLMCSKNLYPSGITFNASSITTAHAPDPSHSLPALAPTPYGTT